VIIDSTDQKRLESQLRQAQKMEAIGTLAGGIAHDFNNILAAILMYAEMALRDIPETSPTHGDLEQVVGAAQRARDLVKQILVFSRQREEEKRHPVQLSPMIKETLKLLRASLPSTIEIRQSISRSDDWALADPTQIHQVLLNLCDNAAHAMAEKGGVLEVTLDHVELDRSTLTSHKKLKPGRFLRLGVSDTGHGIAPGNIQRIFDPYFTTKEPGEGTGLGLAVVHGIVERHDGAVMVQSRQGKGSKFEVFFPTIEGSPAVSHHAPRALPGGTERILLVDDEEALLKGRKRTLENLGYQIVATRNGLEALDAFRTQPEGFDLVITDYTKPQMTGLKLAREIMRIRPDMPIILCTGSGTRDVHEQAAATGIREVAVKPFSLRDFAAVIRKVLDSTDR
jgi:nitrogen-specific signal transduction histidine kinase/ActR/RegA family two-component response regulator